MLDVLALWGSPAWRAGVDAWVAEALAGHGAEVRGAGEQVRLRFWSTVVRYPTSAGDVWFKECNPGQAFEGPLLDVLSRLVPGAFPAPLAVEGPRLLLPGAGTVLGAGADGSRVEPSEQVLARLLGRFAEVQRALVPHAGAVLAAGLPRLGAADVPGYLRRLAEQLHARPPHDPQHLDADGLARVRAGAGWVAEWCGALTASGVPESFQHHDLSPRNTAVRADGGHTFFDVGDGFWSHPFAVVQVPVAMATGTWPFGPREDDPVAARLLDAYLEPWTADGHDLADLRTLAGPARLLAQVHRAESWRRLLAAVPADRLGREAPRVADWLLAAVSR